MGYLDSLAKEAGGAGGTLDLTEFEQKLLHKLNDGGTLNTRWKAAEVGIDYSKKRKAPDIYTYDGAEEICICPEPLTFLRKFDDVSDNREKAVALFEKMREDFQRFRLEAKPVPLIESDIQKEPERMWLNKTLTGINLRPGNLNDDRDAFPPVKMCDDNVHGLIAGRTGSGKSVFINALILSLITEYPPWELDLYLADFKKVELSRYMNDSDKANLNTAFTPHIRACAATSEIRYVISLIQYLVDCMNARNEFFTRLGVTKIQEFRNEYDLVLPRVLLIVDEFQQMFSEATNREAEEIQTMLNSITKLGRATGFHLIFASQEMSGTLRGNTLANFKIRMALPCNKQISLDILGNGAAEQLERGYVLINTEAGDELSNQKYRVPFIETDQKDAEEEGEKKKTPFFHYLDGIKLAAKNFPLEYKTGTQKFYREELQEQEQAFLDDLDRIKEKKNSGLKGKKDLFDGIVLGKTVLYSERRNDKVSFYLERGRNKGVMIATPNADDAARMRKLLMENFVRSDEHIVHIALELNSLVHARFPSEEMIEGEQEYHSMNEEDGLEQLRVLYELRRGSLRCLKEKTMSPRICRMMELKRKLTECCEKEESRRKQEEYEQEVSKWRNREEELKERWNALSEDSLPENPALEFLTRCDSAIVMIQSTKETVGYQNLKIYREITELFRYGTDIGKIMEEADRRLSAEILKYEGRTDRDSGIVLLRLKILRRTLLYFGDRYLGKEPVKTVLTPDLDGCYRKLERRIHSYREAAGKKQQEEKQKEELQKELESVRDRLELLQEEKPETEKMREEVLELAREYAEFCYEKAVRPGGLKKEKPVIPKVNFYCRKGRWILEAEKEEKEDGEKEALFRMGLNQILEIAEKYEESRDISGSDFEKCIFWINGLDEIEKLPGYVPDVIRDSINYNILVVVMITSELRDSTIRKAFDYAFITGNVEKFYNMFDIRYTKQPLDSIVVNFGIRSKGLSLPFKIYKSNLNDMKSPGLLEELLEDMG